LKKMREREREGKGFVTIMGIVPSLWLWAIKA
jgi:hypothetical protein